MQARLTGQDSGKWPIGLVYLSKPPITANDIPIKVHKFRVRQQELSSSLNNLNWLKVIGWTPARSTWVFVRLPKSCSDALTSVLFLVFRIWSLHQIWSSMQRKLLLCPRLRRWLKAKWFSTKQPLNWLSIKNANSLQLPHLLEPPQLSRKSL